MSLGADLDVPWLKSELSGQRGRLAHNDRQLPRLAQQTMMTCRWPRWKRLQSGSRPDDRLNGPVAYKPPRDVAEDRGLTAR